MTSYRLTSPDIPRQTLVLFGHTVLIIAGADSNLTIEEKDFFYNEAARLNITDDIIEEWEKFDWKKGDLQHTIGELKPLLTPELSKYLIYSAIRISIDDSSYPLAEQDAVRQAAEQLDVDDKTVVELEILASMDKNVTDLKRLTFSF